MINFLLALGLGLGAGTITGLVPGIHVNLICTFLLAGSAYLLGFFNPTELACFIVAMSITHTFLDSIPSIYLGAPDSSQVLGVLPGHRYLLRGHGHKAVLLTLIGSFYALLIGMLLLPLMIYLVPRIYEFIKGFLVWILIGIVLWNLAEEKKKIWALTVFLFSGVLGWLVFGLEMDNGLFPMLSGLFGVSTLLYSLFQKTSLPKQIVARKISVRRWHGVKAVMSSTLAGGMTAFLPGIGASQGAIIAMKLARDIGDQGFLILVGGVNTVNFLLSLATFYTIDKARNGAVIAVQQLLESFDLGMLIQLSLVALIAGGLATVTGILVSRLAAARIAKVKYSAVVSFTIIFVTLMVIVLTRGLGLLILFIGTAIGLIPAIVKVRRTEAMGCLLLPVILFYLGLG